jgi:hypothetical protein
MESVERCPNSFIYSLLCLSSPGFGSSGSLCLRLTGVETGVVYSEESQNTCAKGRRDKITESGFESMARKVTYQQALVAHGWVVLDPTDIGLIESVYKKSLREGEERLMLAVLESAVEDFQKYVLARNLRGKKLFQQAEEWFLEKNSDELFSFENICETLQLHPDYIRPGLMGWKEAKLKTLSVEDHHQGRRQLASTRVTHNSVRLSKSA